MQTEPRLFFAAPRRTLMRTGLLGSLLALLAACSTVPRSGDDSAAMATPADIASLRAMVSQQERLDRIAGPLLVNNTELCRGNARQLFGFTAKNKYSYSSAFVDAAQQALGLDEQLQVTGILSGSGAARVGLRRGDKLVAAENQAIPQGPNAQREAAAVLGPLTQGRSAVKLTLKRSDNTLSLSVPLTLACAFSVNLGNSSNVIAYGDGQRILISRGMLEFAQSDEEIAYVLAKEMSHNALAHAEQQNISATVADIINNLTRVQPDMSTLTGRGGVPPYSQEMDAAADTLSLYMLARAGYNVNHAPRFWQRLAAQYPASVSNGYTAIHPATAYRLAVMDKILATVKAKLAAKQPLFP